MKKHLLPSLLGIALLAASTSAEAASRTVFISGSDLSAGGGSTESAFGVAMPDAATSFVVNLTLPKGFKPNSTATLQLRMVGGGTSCGITLVAAGTFRIRPGAITAITPSPASGLTVVGSGTFTTPAAALQAFTKKFKLAPPTSGAGQKTGDTVAVVINRDGGGAGDTCTGGLTVTSVRFIYQLP